jgi:long-chain acyl-CoA synthetase
VHTAEQAKTHPDQPAIIMGATGETVTFAEYEAASNRVAQLLRACGLRRRDHIAVFMENCPEPREIEGGAERAGLYYSLINTYLAADEVAYIITNSRARMLFSSPARQPVAEAAAAKSPGLERRLITGEAEPPPGGGKLTPAPSARRSSANW